MRLELLGSSVEVPDGWELADTAALEPAEGDGFRASAVLSAEPLGDVDFSTWQDTADAAAPSVLTDFRLIDREHVTVDGHPGGRRVAHHLAPTGHALVMEQWVTVLDAVGWTLTLTVDAPRYDLLADPFAGIASSWRLPEAVTRP
ncbi:hypothetical protein [Nocardioides nematodiphilus]|uniref:hypothetical protein n=1 Tax=Nocardioides nematodiphilus TaxID=2849669 RepID=UPI001CD9B641|nr:hypothetical protein [Nocardioides nematodiphilus]MCA1981798.1 hypothetical protein [Nocardioides nematodiphilus]